MKHYVDEEGRVFAYEADGSQDHLIEGKKAISEAEAMAAVHVDPPPAEVRDAALRSLLYDFGDGRVIQVRPQPFSADEANIRNAIERMGRLGIESQDWYMADNKPYPVTAAELQAALEGAQDLAAQIWADFFVSVSQS